MLGVKDIVLANASLSDRGRSRFNGRREQCAEYSIQTWSDSATSLMTTD